jgi:hypothetical protein
MIGIVSLFLAMQVGQPTLNRENKRNLPQVVISQILISFHRMEISFQGMSVK